MTLNRRQMIQAAGAAALGLGPWLRARGAQGGGSKKILFFTKSSGFQHSVVTRKGDELSHAERILTQIGKVNGFEVVCSKDGRLFDPDKIGQWDAFVFCTTGDLTTEGTDKQPPMSEEGERALYDAVRSGKGFVGMHCATDTFGHHRGRGADDPFIKLIGAEFSGHGKQQEATIKVVDRDFPGAKSFGSEFRLLDEWYGLKNIADDLHVIMIQVTEGMEGKDYARPNYPETWARMHGQGRVFYTSMGHREDVWANPWYQELLMGSLRWATGQVDHPVKPNIDEVTPGYREVPGK